MYTRAIDATAGEIRIPNNYDGSLLGGQGLGNESGVHTDEIPAGTTERPPRSENPFSALFQGFFKNGRFSLQSIEFEDLLIIGIGLYLLLSREGDKECGILLLLLLFIN